MLDVAVNTLAMIYTGGLACAWCLGLMLIAADGGVAAADDVVRFGASLSLTGGLSTEGKQCKDGYDFYVKHINEQGGIPIAGKKYKVEIVYYDDASNPDTAAKLVEKQLDEDKETCCSAPMAAGRL